MFDEKEYRLENIDFSHTVFSGREGFDVYLSVIFNSEFKKQYGVGNGFVLVSCNASGEMFDIEFEDAYGRLDDVELTFQEEKDVLYFLAKHSIVEEEKDQNEGCYV